MRFFIMFLPLLILGFSLNSASNILAEDIQKIRVKILKRDNEIREIEKEIKAIDEAFQAEKKIYVNLGLPWTPSSSLSNEQKRLEDLKRKTEDIRSGLKIDFEELITKQDKHTDKIIKRQKDTAKLFDEVKLNTQFLKFSLNYTKLFNNLATIDEQLDAIERVYDKSVMGAYLQDKIGQLLNSDVICTARKRCLDSKPIKISPETIRKELFPESVSGKQRSDYHDKARKNRNRPGTQ